MKTTVSVIVVQPFEWKGQEYIVGQSITLSPLDAVVLAKKHKVTLTKRKAVVPPVEPPKPTPEPEPVRHRRGYRRRDLQAEESTELPTPPIEQTDPDPAA